MEPLLVRPDEHVEVAETAKRCNYPQADFFGVQIIYI